MSTDITLAGHISSFKALEAAVRWAQEAEARIEEVRTDEQPFVAALIAQAYALIAQAAR
jgi:hypothetical protein